jgi:hypothetical protein
MVKILKHSFYVKNLIKRFVYWLYKTRLPEDGLRSETYVGTYII